jgi:glycosyltransferase involved in cell wall biosynthesis
MQNEPLVSILLPSYNHEQYVEEAIASLLNQTYKNIELIIIDDFSADGTFEMIRRLASSDSRIKCYRNEKNLGISNTMNRAIALASGEYIMTASSDDIWETYSVQTLVNEASRQNKSCIIVWGDGIVIDSRGKILNNSFIERIGANKRRKEGNLFKELLKGNYIFDQARIVPASKMEEVKYDPDLKYLNDYLVNIFLAERCTFKFISDRKLARYRIHGENTILRDDLDWTLDDIKVKKIILSEFRNRLNLSNKAYLNIVMWYKFGLYVLKMEDKRNFIGNHKNSEFFKLFSDVLKSSFLSIFYRGQG